MMNSILSPLNCLKTVFTICLMLYVNLSYGQSTKEIHGIIKDGAGLTMPGVNITIKGTEDGTISDADGKYTLSVKSSDVLIFSFVGFKDHELVVGDQTQLNIVLKEDGKALDEIVVIGYGIVEKKDATGSITSISSEDFNKGVQGSAQDLIVGKMSGVQVTPSAEPGGEARIRIRGGSSLSASNKPLFVIDGVIFSDEQVSGLGNPLNLINANDIENVTVLKDASATAIYGSRAANGVILVTTKKGKAGKKIGVVFDTKTSLSTLGNKIKVFTGDEYRAFLREKVDDGTILGTIFSDGYVKENETINTDWQDEIYQLGIASDNNISLTGGLSFADKLILPIRLSLGSFYQRGILKTSTYARNSVSLGLNPSLLDDHLTVNINARYTHNDSRFADKAAVNQAVTFDPTKPVLDANSPYGGYYYWPANLSAPTGIPHELAPINPVAQLMLKNDGAVVHNFNGNAQFDYKFQFYPSLRANLNLATVRSSTNGNKIESKDASWTIETRDVEGVSTQFKGKSDKYTATVNNDLLEFYLNYSTDKISVGKLDVMAGYSWQKFYRETNNHVRVIEPDRLERETVDKSENYLVSFYGRANFNLLKKYLFTFTLRQDGSSRFIGDNQWGLFPAAAFAWRLKDESFLTDSPVLNDLKLRIGYGVTGQENISKNYYPALARAVLSDQNTRYVFGATPLTTVRLEGYDSSLKWETTTTYNMGVDFAFLDGKLNGSVDVYHRITNDLLNTIPIPVGANFTNEILTNVGSLTNTGLELTMQGVVFSSEDHEVILGANITYNKNEVTKLTAVDDPNYLGVRTGAVDGATGTNVQIHAVGSPINTFFLYQQIYDSSGKPIPGAYVDQNGDNIINDKDLVKNNSSNPDIYGGLNGRYNYKQWTLSFSGRFSFNNYVYDNISSQFGTYSNVFLSGFSSNTLSTIRDSNFNGGEYLSDYYLHNASFFRMDNINLGYNFGKIIANKVALSASFVMQNVFVITNYSGLDPEIANGIDNKVYPRARTYTLGLTLRI